MQIRPTDFWKSPQKEIKTTKITKIHPYNPVQRRAFSHSCPLYGVIGGEIFAFFAVVFSISLFCLRDETSAILHCI